MSPEEHAKNAFFEQLLEEALRERYGPGAYYVSISQDRTNIGHDRWRSTHLATRDINVANDASLINQFAYAEKMMLFWGERAKKLQDALDGKTNR